jgi:hypothetical protein
MAYIMEINRENKMKDKAFENYYRRQAKRLHLKLEKSRARKWGIDDHQGWRIIDYDNNIVAGEKWDLTIEKVAQYLDDLLIKLKAS